jgi:hypothetical protein
VERPKAGRLAAADVGGVRLEMDEARGERSQQAIGQIDEVR